MLYMEEKLEKMRKLLKKALEHGITHDEDEISLYSDHESYLKDTYGTDFDELEELGVEVPLSKNKDYTVTVKVTGYIDVNVKAKNEEDARQLAEDKFDFLEIGDLEDVERSIDHLDYD